MGFIDYEKLKEHFGHKIVIVKYGDGQNYSLECEGCCEVLTDYGSEDDCPEKCPVCGSEGIEYEGLLFGLIDGSMSDNWHCPDCGAEGVAKYSFVFLGHEIASSEKK
jgi:rubredoxin